MEKRFGLEDGTIWPSAGFKAQKGPSRIITFEETNGPPDLLIEGFGNKELRKIYELLANQPLSFAVARDDRDMVLMSAILVLDKDHKQVTKRLSNLGSLREYIKSGIEQKNEPAS